MLVDKHDKSIGSIGVGDKGGDGIVVDDIADLIFDCLVGFCCFLVVMELWINFLSLVFLNLSLHRV